MSEDILDLRELLGKTTGDFPDMPDFPAEKTFYGKITGIAAGTSRVKSTPYFELGVRLSDAGPDVPASWTSKLKEQGFSLADYTTGCKFYLTPGAMRILRRFLDSMNFPTNVRLDEMLKLDPETFNPTEETQELFRGRDVLARTKPAGDNGRVYSGELDSIAGIKRD